MNGKNSYQYNQKNCNRNIGTSATEKIRSFQPFHNNQTTFNVNASTHGKVLFANNEAANKSNFNQICELNAESTNFSKSLKQSVQAGKSQTAIMKRNGNVNMNENSKSSNDSNIKFYLIRHF